MGSKNDLINKTMKYSTNIDIIPSSVHKLNPQFSLCIGLWILLYSIRQKLLMRN